jgi:glycosyltransferase involved in cell wall biosynthesis
MKILYFHQHFSTPNGSTGTRSYEFSKALIKAGHQVTIICGSYWIADSGLSGEFAYGMRRGLVDGIRVIELELPYSNTDNYFKRTWIFVKYSIAGIRIALTQSHDVLFATSTPLTAGIPGIIAKLLYRKRFVFEVRDLWPELPKAMGVISNPIALKAMEILETISYKLADKCIAVAPGIAQGIKQKFPHKIVAIIPNGSDELQIVNNDPIQKDKFVAAFTGAHGQANGLHAVLDVALILKNREELDIEFQFIGDGKLKPMLMERAKNEKLDNCRFLTPMPKFEMFQYLHDNADIGLMILDNIPAFYNGTSPNKFFDYLSLGLPVLNNYPGWVASLIKDNNCGRVVPPGDPLSFAEALIDLRNNDHDREEMGLNALRLSKRKFGRRLLAERFVKFIVVG